MDAKRKINWLSLNIYSRNLQWNKTARALNQYEPIKKTFKNILYRLQHVYKQIQPVNISELHFGIIHALIWKTSARIWINSNTAVCSFRFSHVYRRIFMNKILKLNTKFTSQQCGYLFTQVDRWNESSIIDQSIWQLMQRKRASFLNENR